MSLTEAFLLVKVFDFLDQFLPGESEEKNMYIKNNSVAHNIFGQICYPRQLKELPLEPCLDLHSIIHELTF